MSLSDEQQQHAHGQRGAPILLSYKELVTLNDRMAKIDARLEIALTLPAEHKALELRVTSLETERAVRQAEGRQRGKAADYIWHAGMTLIAGGVWWPIIKSAFGIH